MKTKHLIREKFRTDVFRRDGFKCKVCGKDGVNEPYLLDAHHITNRNLMPNGGYVKENGISLCGVCHLEAEEFHIRKTWSNGFHPDDLYKLIGSSKEKAEKASLKI